MFDHKVGLYSTTSNNPKFEINMKTTCCPVEIFTGIPWIGGGIVLGGGILKNWRIVEDQDPKSAWIVGTSETKGSPNY